MVIPAQLPIAEWSWHRAETRAWVVGTFGVKLLPQIICIVLLLLLLLISSIYACRGGKRGCVNRQSAIRLAFMCGLVSLLFCILLLYQCLLVLDSATAFHATAITSVNEASNFACGDGDAVPLTSQCRASSPASCSEGSFVGYVLELLSRITRMLLAARNLFSQLDLAIGAVPQITNASATAATIASNVIDGIIAVNATIEVARGALASAATTAQPYFPVNPVAWQPVSYCHIHDERIAPLDRHLPVPPPPPPPPPPLVRHSSPPPGH